MQVSSIFFYLFVMLYLISKYCFYVIMVMHMSLDVSVFMQCMAHTRL